MWAHGRGRRAPAVPATQLSLNPTPLPWCRKPCWFSPCFWLSLGAQECLLLAGGLAGTAGTQHSFGGHRQESSRDPHPGLGSGQACSLQQFLGRWSCKFFIVFQFSLCPMPLQLPPALLVVFRTEMLLWALSGVLFSAFINLL